MISARRSGTDHAANQLGGLSLAKAQESDAGSASDESIYEDGEVQEGEKYSKIFSLQHRPFLLNFLVSGVLHGHIFCPIFNTR